MGLTVEPVDLIGWAATLVLVITLWRQIWKQWQANGTEAVSGWLFVGQITASLLFILLQRTAAILGIRGDQQPGVADRSSRSDSGEIEATKKHQVMFNPRIVYILKTLVFQQEYKA